MTTLPTSQILNCFLQVNLGNSKCPILTTDLQITADFLRCGNMHSHLPEGHPLSPQNKGSWQLWPLRLGTLNMAESLTRTEPAEAVKDDEMAQFRTEISANSDSSGTNLPSGHKALMYLRLEHGKPGLSFIPRSVRLPSLPAYLRF